MPFKIKITSKNINNHSYSLYYSLTKGINWTEISNNVQSSEYLWNVPSIKGYRNILLKAEFNKDKSVNDIVKMPVFEQSANISILEPNGNERYTINEKIPIISSIKKIYDKTIDIYYSSNGGLDWNIIESNVSNSGKYSWSIIDKDFNCAECKIKVQSRTDKDVFDVSNGLISYI